MTSMGFVENWSGLMAARWWLGLCEAGLYPGVNYFLSCWYKRNEFGIRAVSSIVSIRFLLIVSHVFRQSSSLLQLSWHLLVG